MAVDFNFELGSVFDDINRMSFEESWEHIEMTILINACNNDVWLGRANSTGAGNFLYLGVHRFRNELNHCIGVSGPFVIY